MTVRETPDWQRVRVLLLGLYREFRRLGEDRLKARWIVTDIWRKARAHEGLPA